MRVLVSLKSEIKQQMCKSNDTNKPLSQITCKKAECEPTNKCLFYDCSTYQQGVSRSIGIAIIKMMI